MWERDSRRVPSGNDVERPGETSSSVRMCICNFPMLPYECISSLLPTCDIFLNALRDIKLPEDALGALSCKPSSFRKGLEKG
jgi:hypothetical protein